MIVKARSMLEECFKKYSWMELAHNRMELPMYWVDSQRYFLHYPTMIQSGLILKPVNIPKLSIYLIQALDNIFWFQLQYQFFKENLTWAFHFHPTWHT